MARGRLVLTSISESEKVNALGSLFAQILFTWLIPHADMNGREKANPQIVRGKIVPLIDCDEDQVGAAIYRMHHLGLVRLYESDGAAYLEFTGWEHNQTIRKDREKPSHPAPTATFPRAYARFRQQAGSTPGPLPEHSTPTEPNLTEPNPTESMDSSTSRDLIGSPPRRVAQARRARVPYQDFADAWNEAAPNLPAVRKLNDARIRGIDLLCKEHGIAEALEMLRNAATQVGTDPFWIERGYGFDNLVPKKVLEKAEKLNSQAQRDNHGPLAEYRQAGI